MQASDPLSLANTELSLPDAIITTDLWVAWRVACQSLNLVLPDNAEERFTLFYILLSEANRQFNLTRITAPEDYLYRHLLDSLTLLPHIPQGASVMDIGSGAGLPAIPLAIASPDISITAVESIDKKSRFIAHAQEALGLNNLAIERDRAEILARVKGTRDSLDIVTARAVAALPTLLEYCMPLVRVGGHFLAMKGRSCQEELEASTKALKILGGKLLDIQSFEHSSLEGSRLLIIEKIRPTPLNYPRHTGAIRNAAI